MFALMDWGQTTQSPDHSCTAKLSNQFAQPLDDDKTDLNEKSKKGGKETSNSADNSLQSEGTKAINSCQAGASSWPDYAGRTTEIDLTPRRRRS